MAFDAVHARDFDGERASSCAEPSKFQRQSTKSVDNFVGKAADGGAKALQLKASNRLPIFCAAIKLYKSMSYVTSVIA